MPYHIEKYKTGFRAVDNKNKPLSKKPMTKKNVKKQIIAVHLSKLRAGKKLDVFRKK